MLPNEYNGLPVLSVKQPWGEMIVAGYKPVENRTWNTSQRGTILIHASKGLDTPGYSHLEMLIRTRKMDMGRVILPPISELSRGGIIGAVDIVSVIRKGESIEGYTADELNAAHSPFFTGEYGFVLKSPRRLEFLPAKGMLGFFKI